MAYEHKIKLTEDEVYEILVKYLCQKDPVLSENKEKILSGGLRQIGFFGEWLTVPVKTFELIFELQEDL